MLKMLNSNFLDLEDILISKNNSNLCEVEHFYVLPVLEVVFSSEAEGGHIVSRFFLPVLTLLLISK